VKGLVKTRGFGFNSSDRTSAANVATKAGDAGDIADCTLVHSIKSLLFNALTSCSTESSRMGSGVMVVVVNSRGARHSFCGSSGGRVFFF
jgi:hypothetical protein